MKLRAVRLMIQEEAVGMDIREPDVATMIFKKISPWINPWKQALRKVEVEDEILQTKVGGVQDAEGAPVVGFGDQVGDGVALREEGGVERGGKR